VLANNFKKSLIAANIGLVLTAGVSSVAYANEGSKVQEDVEVIEVRGLRSSLKANINNKRFANNVVDSITAEDIGKFPDKNVADSLARITGVAVSREFGEGEKITIRGAGPKYNRTLLNGQSVGTADWFILDEANRSFNYTMLPSVIISELEVYKSPSANIEEGSLGGTVILRTRQPLKLDANTGAVSVEAQYSEKSGETDPLVSGMYSWKNDDETIGVLVSAVKQDRSVERTGFEVLGWIEDDNDNYIVPRNIGVPLFIQDRERETLFATLQYAPNDSLVATLNVLDSKMDANNQNANLINFLYAEREAAIKNATKVGSDGAIVAGTNPDGRFAYNYINRISSTETNQIHLDVDYSTDDFTLNFEIGSTKAEGGTVRETSWEYNAQTAYSYDLTGTPNVQLDIDPYDGSEFTAGWIWGGAKPTTDEESWLQVDVDYPVEVGPFTAIKTGLKVKDAERTQGRHAYSWHAPTEGHYLDFIKAECPTLASCGLDALGKVSVDAPSLGNLTQQLAQNRAVMESIAFGGLNGRDASYFIHDNLPEIWAVEENTIALYVQGDFSGDGYRGNVGIRYVSTDQTSGGYEYSGETWGLNTLNGEWLSPEVLNWVTKDNDYSEFLPSFNVAFDLTEDQIFRVGAARVLSRQNWADISGSETFGSLVAGSTANGSRGNPNLKPTIANQFDLSYEWYYGDSSLFSATYFAKDLSSLRTMTSFIEERFDEESQTYVPVDFAQPGNGKGGNINGIELSVQHDFGGYGVTANYTYTDASAEDAEAEVDGTSKNMLNLSAYYENDSLSARVMYNYRSDWYKGFHFNGDKLYNDEFGQWDASFNYNLNENLSFNLEVVNITDEQVVEYNEYEHRVMGIYENGRRFVVGAKYNF